MMNEVSLNFLKWLEERGYKDIADKIKQNSRSLSQTRRLIYVIPEAFELWKQFIKESKS
jgi:hypothetical protein